MTFLLTRSDTGMTDGGIFTIGVLRRDFCCPYSMLNTLHAHRGGGFCACGGTLRRSAACCVYIAMDDLHGWRQDQWTVH